MIPSLIYVPGALWPLLPPGIHIATLHEIKAKFVTNQRRENLFNGLKQGLDHLFSLGCSKAYLDGSYVTGKPFPNDYEVVWDTSGVDPYNLDPVFFEFSDGRKAQKQKYLGEYFPSAIKEGGSGRPFLEFFQTDKDSGRQKGILQIVNYSKGGGII